MTNAAELKEKLLQANITVAVITHRGPDGDAYSSARVIQKVVKRLNKKAKVDLFADNSTKNAPEGKVAELYEPLFSIASDKPNSPSVSGMLNPPPLKKYDIVIVTDCAQPVLMGKYQHIFDNADFKINIDHHATNTQFGDMNIVEERSSTCELIYDILKEGNINITDWMASLLCVGIITDTNNRQVNDSQRTDEVIAEIKGQLGKERVNSIREWFFETYPRSKNEILSDALSRTEYLYDNRMALFTITQEDLDYSKAEFEDTLGIINVVKAVREVELAIGIVEKEPGYFYVSLRSKGEVDVLEIAKSFKGGGNGKNMGAFQFAGNLEALRRKLHSESKRQLRIVPPKAENINPFIESAKERKAPVFTEKEGDPT